MPRSNPGQQYPNPAPGVLATAPQGPVLPRATRAQLQNQNCYKQTLKINAFLEPKYLNPAPGSLVITPLTQTRASMTSQQLNRTNKRALLCHVDSSLYNVHGSKKRKEFQIFSVVLYGPLSMPDLVTTVVPYIKKHLDCLVLQWH